mgnify:CR=1 FL=1
MRPAQLEIILDQEFLSTEHGHHTPVMLWGPPGVGKSQMVAQIGARHGVSVIDIRLSQMEPSDLRGIPFRSGETVEWAVPAILPDADRHGPAGIAERCQMDQKMARGRAGSGGLLARCPARRVTATPLQRRPPSRRPLRLGS